MTPLHTIYSAAALERCLGRATSDSTLLLLEDGVYAGLAPLSNPARALYVLAEDLAARGLGRADLAPGVGIVDMKGFVALTVAHTPIVGWF